jgi:hypothetical protein
MGRMPVSCPIHRVALAAALALAGAGCIERKMVLRTEPPGAVAYVDDERIGVTPCETTFTHYGTRHVVLEYRRQEFLKANGGTAPPRYEGGFRRVTADAPLDVPWYQYPVLDLVTEVVLPVNITDRQEFVYTLEPAEAMTEDRERLQARRAALLERALAVRELMRQRNEEERKSIGLPEGADENAGPGTVPATGEPEKKAPPPAGGAAPK